VKNFYKLQAEIERLKRQSEEMKEKIALEMEEKYSERLQENKEKD